MRSVRARAFDHALKVGVFLALGAAAKRADLVEEVGGLERIALFGMPHAVIGPGAHVARIGGKRLLIPVLGVVVAAKLAACEADVVGDVGVSVLAERAQGNDAGL